MAKKDVSRNWQGQHFYFSWIHVWKGSLMFVIQNQVKMSCQTWWCLWKICTRREHMTCCTTHTLAGPETMSRSARKAYTDSKQHFVKKKKKLLSERLKCIFMINLQHHLCILAHLSGKSTFLSSSLASCCSSCCSCWVELSHSWL